MKELHIADFIQQRFSQIAKKKNKKTENNKKIKLCYVVFCQKATVSTNRGPGGYK